MSIYCYEVIVLNNNYCKYACYLKALGDETRIKIFCMLSQGELCACKILEKFTFKQPTLSYHMKILTDSGLVNCKRDGVWMKYSVNDENFEEMKKLFCEIHEVLCKNESDKK